MNDSEDSQRKRSIGVAFSDWTGENKIIVYLITIILGLAGLQIPQQSLRRTDTKIDTVARILQLEIDSLKINTRRTENNIQNMGYKLDILLRLSCANKNISMYDKTISGLECR